MNKGRVALYSLAHMATDYATAGVPALLPLFAAAYGWSYGILGSLALVANLSSALGQPLWGQVTDRARILLMPWGLLAVFLGFLYLSRAPSYEHILFALFLAGMGSSAFHPDASSSVRRHAPHRPAVALGWFQVAGNIGMALAPLSVALFMTAQTLHRIALLGLPAGLFALILLLHHWRENNGKAPAHRKIFPKPEGAPSLRALLPPLAGIIVLRGLGQAALATILPLHYQDHLGWTPSQVNYLLFGVLLAGALATLTGGFVAERWGDQWAISGSLYAAFLPALLAWLLPPPWGVLFLLLANFFFMMSWSVTTSYAQR
ncbi:MAG: MFS transporter, partial [Bacillota bacterium]|nr:MFS transporter [Bacillota bacterium]